MLCSYELMLYIEISHKLCPSITCEVCGIVCNKVQHFDSENKLQLCLESGKAIAKQFSVKRSIQSILSKLEEDQWYQSLIRQKLD